MNIESLLFKIKLFDDLVIKSGFKRDIEDYIQSLQQPQNRNLTFMKDLSEKVKFIFEEFKNNSLNNELENLLTDTVPFTEKDYVENILEINSNNEINSNDYYNKFVNILNNILSEVNNNEQEILSKKEVFEKYIKKEIPEADLLDDNGALMSLIFKDLKSTKSLKEFSKVLLRWNRALTLYHTLLSSESPEEIELVTIQKGSIDVIFNVNFDIALNLTELIKVGMFAFSGYLAYKYKVGKEIIETYLGNKKLIELEKERDKLMLENIKTAIVNKLTNQHKEKLKEDKKIDKSGVDNKIKEISSIITDHIIRGNEVKFLSYIEKENDEENVSDKLRKMTTQVNENLNRISKEDKKLLLEFYELKDE